MFDYLNATESINIIDNTIISLGSTKIYWFLRTEKPEKVKVISKNPHIDCENHQFIKYIFGGIASRRRENTTIRGIKIKRETIFFRMGGYFGECDGDIIFIGKSRYNKLHLEILTFESTEHLYQFLLMV